ncbi:MAG: twin-arginine translocation signal domain-containing protein, partial [Bacteroidia bacterium]
MITRRSFIKGGILASGAAALGASPDFLLPTSYPETKKIKIARVGSNFEREPLIRPFGFKGGYMKEIWQTVSYLESSSGLHSIGLCSQSVLWSDANVFVAHSESGGNALMYAMTERAMQMLNGESYTTPHDLLDVLYNEIYEYGKKITGNPFLRKTFALNSLVGIDNALWLLYAGENGINTFDDLIPSIYK